MRISDKYYTKLIDVAISIFFTSDPPGSDHIIVLGGTICGSSGRSLACMTIT